MNFRYAGKSGSYVNGRELDAVKSLLPDSGRILDVPCGVGRLTSVLDRTKYHLVGVDYSEAMLDAASPLYHENWRGNAANLPFPDKSFDAIVTLRFFIHYDNIKPFLKEFKRLIKDDGIIIFERYRWTPLMFNILVNVLGGKTFIHSKKDLMRILEEEGLELVEQKSCFLFSPFVYARLPFFIVKALHAVEELLPEGIRVDNYWKVKRKNARS
jgi:ubiquinone/menaquinone biosynthesis C-methylase UbiE